MEKRGLFLLLALFSAHALAEEVPNTRVTYPVGISAEILGRGMLWSINFERVVSEQAAVGVGYGQVATEQSEVETDRSARMIPVWMNYYLSDSGNSAFVTGGANVVLNSGSVKRDTATVSALKLPNDAILPVAGGGYESRTDTGFLFRFGAYLLVGDNVKPWMGFTFGQTF